MTRTFVKVFTDLDDHPAWMDLDNVHLGLWLRALLYCRRNLTDGHFSARVTRRWGDPGSVPELVQVGRWHEPGHDCADCPQPAEGSLYLHAFLEVQNSRDKVSELSEKRAEAGRRGGISRAGKQLASKAGGKSQADSGKGQAEEKRREEKEPAAGAAEFDLFWAAYPKRVGKTAAAKAWAKAVKSANPGVIIAGLGSANAEWTAARTESQFIPHPATWLNAGRWADEPATLPGTVEPPKGHTLMQCRDSEPHGRHLWTDGRNQLACQGAEA